MRLSRSILLLSICGLAACGGGGGGSDDGGSDLERLTLSQLQTRANSLVDTLDAADVTPGGDLPTAGNITYTGYLAVLLGNELDNPVDGAIGPAELVADFEDNKVNGRAGNFVNEDGNLVDGELTISNGRISRTAINTITADIKGSLTLTDGVAQIDEELAGSFLGDDGEFVQGIFAGNTAYDGEQTAYTGLLQAER